MTPSTISTVRMRRRSAGVGLVTAIFLLVVLAGLAVALVAIFNSQRQGILLDEQGTRAYQAARAGIEWGLYHRLRDTACVDKDQVVALGGSVLAGFSVHVNCRALAGPESNDPDVKLERWIIRSEACAPAAPDGSCPTGSADPDYVRRVIEVQI